MTDLDLLIESVQRALVRDVAASITRVGDSLGLGFRASDGHEIPLRVEGRPNGDVRLSDGGETWRDLVMSGLVESRPSGADGARLEQLCRLHGVSWDPYHRELFGVASIERAPDLARRVVAASLALDGWRVWGRAHEEAHVTQRIVEATARLAPGSGWQATEPQRPLRGESGMAYRPALVLLRGGRRALVTPMTSVAARDAAERAVCWWNELARPLVVIVDARAAQATRARLQEARGVRDYIEVVPRQIERAPAMILDAAARIAAA